jgi:CRP/FNR family transcriptional regulator, cyclic AMP receptor protein
MSCVSERPPLSLPRPAAISTTFEGRLCQILLKDRPVTTVDKAQVIYDAHECVPNIFFVRSGFVKICAIMEDGHELIYDIRKMGDVLGELCASRHPRQDRAVALAETEIIAVPYEDILDVVQGDRGLLREFVQLFSDPLSETYEQLGSMAHGDVPARLVRVLARLAATIGQPVGAYTELPIYLTQETIAQMVAVRREKISTAMNLLRRRGVLDYSRAGNIVFDAAALRDLRRKVTL